MIWTGAGLFAAVVTKIVSSPATDTPWWAVGSMPLLLMTPALIVLSVVIVWVHRRLSKTGDSG